MKAANKGLTILICGGRSFSDREFAFDYLNKLKKHRTNISLVIHGGATGADTLGKEWAIERKIDHLPFKADWDDISCEGAVIKHNRYGKPYNAAAGPLRNQKMLDEGKPDIVVAFDGKTGTNDMIRRAKAARVHVLRPVKKKKKEQEILGNLKTVAIKADVDNPYFDKGKESNKEGNVEKIRAHINMMESPAAIWYHRGKIEQPEYLAASKFRMIYERAQGTGAGAFDYTKEFVDNSGVQDPIDERKAEAIAELAVISRLLGNGYDDMRNVCGLCVPITKLEASRSVQDRLSRNVKLMLPILSEYWGLRSRKQFYA